MSLRDLRSTVLSQLSPAQQSAVTAFRDQLQQLPASPRSVLLELAASQMGRPERRTLSPDAFFVTVVRRAEDLARTVEADTVAAGRDGEVLALLDDLALAQNLHEVTAGTAPQALWARLDAALDVLRRDGRFSGPVRLGLTQAASVAASFRPETPAVALEPASPTRSGRGPGR